LCINIAINLVFFYKKTNIKIKFTQQQKDELDKLILSVNKNFACGLGRLNYSNELNKMAYDELIGDLNKFKQNIKE